MFREEECTYFFRCCLAAGISAMSSFRMYFLAPTQYFSMYSSQFKWPTSKLKFCGAQQINVLRIIVQSYVIKSQIGLYGRITHTSTPLFPPFSSQKAYFEASKTSASEAF